MAGLIVFKINFRYRKVCSTALSQPPTLTLNAMKLKHSLLEHPLRWTPKIHYQRCQNLPTAIPCRQWMPRNADTWWQASCSTSHLSSSRLQLHHTWHVRMYSPTCGCRLLSNLRWKMAVSISHSRRCRILLRLIGGNLGYVRLAWWRSEQSGQESRKTLGKWWINGLTDSFRTMDR